MAITYFDNLRLIPTVLQIGRSLVRSQLVSLEVFIDIKTFRSHYGSGVDSASNRNEYQEYFLEGKCDWCVRLTTYHHLAPLSRNLGTLTSWNPLGHSRPVMGMVYLFTDLIQVSIWQLLILIICDCATNRKVAGSIPAGVIGIFH